MIFARSSLLLAGLLLADSLPAGEISPANRQNPGEISPANRQNPGEMPPPGATACSGCHPPGLSQMTPPPLAGLNAEQILAKLRAYRSGEEAASVMDRIAKGITDEQALAIGRWYQTQAAK